jgi:streptomycin 6-kinase
VPGSSARLVSARLPEGLTSFDFAAAATADGRAWMAALPAMVADLAGQWNLVTGQVIGHGYNAVAVAASRAGLPVVLKLAWPPAQVADEARALAAWQGRGMVALLAEDVSRGALLLERLSAARSLASIPVTEAAAAAGALIRTLATPAPAGFLSLSATAAELAGTLPQRQRVLGDLVPGGWLALARRLAAALALDSERSLVHTDLHYVNVLASSRPGTPWVAIDPKPAAGAIERSVAELLWVRADELACPRAITALLDTVVEHGQLDRDKAVAWSFLRCIDYWLWGLANGLTVDPVRCQRVASALEPLARAVTLVRARP